MRSWARKFAFSNNKMKLVKYVLLGRSIHDGILFKSAIFLILACTAVLYVQPMIYILSTSLKSLPDLNDPSIHWVPSRLHWDNYKNAILGLDYWKGFWDTAVLSVSTSLLQVISCGITGYAFARMNFPFKNVLFLLVLLTFLIPPQVLVMPLFIMFFKYGMLNSSLPFVIPAIFAQGLKGSLFIVIFRQFFATLPKELEESAKIDGSGPFKTFLKIMAPLSMPAVVMVLLFSFVWHWNDFYEPSIFLHTVEKGGFSPLSLRFNDLQENLSFVLGGAGQPGAGDSGTAASAVYDNQALKMAAVVLMVLPLILLYLFAQRYFIQGIERTGIVE